MAKALDFIYSLMTEGRYCFTTQLAQKVLNLLVKAHMLHYTASNNTSRS